MVDVRSSLMRQFTNVTYASLVVAAWEMDDGQWRLSVQTLLALNVPRLFR